MYALSLYSNVCQLRLNKTGNKGEKRKEKRMKKKPKLPLPPPSGLLPVPSTGQTQMKSRDQGNPWMQSVKINFSRN